MKKLYLFDFDGTLTYRDTMFLYLDFYDPQKYRIQYLKHFPLFVMVKLKLIEAETVKKSFIGSILKGESEKKIFEKSQKFFEKYYPKIFRQNALDFIQSMNRENTDAFIVTASLDIWVQPFANQLNIPLIATKAEFTNGIFTGNFSTPNCNGREKVVRIKKAIEGRKYDKIIAFGDTAGDQQMMSFANESYYRFFH